MDANPNRDIIHAEDIAHAMELRDAGVGDAKVYIKTGVRPADIVLAEAAGIEAYPYRNPPTITE